MKSNGIADQHPYPDSPAGPADLPLALRRLADSGPCDFALQVLRRVGIPEDRYDVYVLLDDVLPGPPAAGLYIASGAKGLTAALLSSAVTGPEEFAARHGQRTGRRAIRISQPPPGVRTAIRTGRARRLPVDLSGLTEQEQAVLTSVRAVPRGQLRPISWVASEAGLPESAQVAAALARNPLQLLVPCHRVTDDDGRPYDAAYGTQAGDRLRAAEGIDVHEVRMLIRTQTVFLGSDTTRIFCHPTCAHARRITMRHQVPFQSAQDARQAGYRPCKSCRPVAA